jgi:hypothetical protein
MTIYSRNKKELLREGQIEGLDILRRVSSNYWKQKIAPDLTGPIAYTFARVGAVLQMNVGRLFHARAARLGASP